MRIKLRLTKTFLPAFLNFAVFWIFMDILPGVVFRAGPVSRFIAATGFLIAYSFGPFILGFFKLRNNVIAKFIMSSITTAAYLWAVNKFAPDILKLGPTYVGDTDFILFQIPRLLTIEDIYFVLVFCALILVLCCIILERSTKRY